MKQKGNIITGIKCKKKKRHAFSQFVLTVGLQSCRFAAPASCLVDGLHNKDVFGAALQTMHGVVVLLDVGNDHPAVQRVTQT